MTSSTVDFFSKTNMAYSGCSVASFLNLFMKCWSITQPPSSFSSGGRRNNTAGSACGRRTEVPCSRGTSTGTSVDLGGSSGHSGSFISNSNRITFPGAPSTGTAETLLRSFAPHAAHARRREVLIELQKPFIWNVTGSPSCRTRQPSWRCRSREGSRSCRRAGRSRAPRGSGRRCAGAGAAASGKPEL